MLEIILEQLPELESIGRVEVEEAECLTDSSDLLWLQPPVLLNEKLANAFEDGGRPDPGEQ